MVNIGMLGHFVHCSLATICNVDEMMVLSEHQVKLAEQKVDQDETKDPISCGRYNLSVHHLSITLEKM